MQKAAKARLKNIRELLREKKQRDADGLFVAEGSKIVRDMAGKGHVPEFMVVSHAFMSDEENRSFVRDMEERSVPVLEASDSELDKISSLQNSQGVLAVFKQPDRPKAELFSGAGAFMILCDGIQDPGNLGAMIRTAAAFDVDAVILTGESVDAYNPKVVRASSGSILDVPVYSCGENEVDMFKGNGYYLLASSAIKRDRRKISEIKELPARSIIVFGSEGKGISPGICAKVDEYFHIPVSTRVESLNVTTAAAISLHAFSRLKK